MALVLFSAVFFSAVFVEYMKYVTTNHGHCIIFGMYLNGRYTITAIEAESRETMAVIV